MCVYYTDKKKYIYIYYIYLPGACVFIELAAGRKDDESNLNITQNCELISLL